MTFNIWTFLFEIVNFLVVAYVLHRLLYRPLREAIDQRQEANARAQAEAEAAQHAAAALQADLAKQHADMENQRHETIRAARALAETERQKLLQETETTLRRRRDEAHQALDRERDEAFTALRSEVVNQAIALADRLLAGAAERSLHQQLTLRLVETLRALPGDEVERLRRQWDPADGAVLETAAAPEPAALNELNEEVARLLDRPVAPAIRTQAALLAGARLRLGGDVWDASLAAQLNGDGDHAAK